MQELITKDCKDCGVTFDISVGEQQWYKDRNFQLPTRCPACRKARRNSKKKK